jgi:hypothetical protein
VKYLAACSNANFSTTNQPALPIDSNAASSIINEDDAQAKKILDAMAATGNLKSKKFAEAGLDHRLVQNPVQA